MADDDVLQEQLSYYRARAQEYDESLRGIGRFAGSGENDAPVAGEEAGIAQALHACGPQERILELACGTGLWTRQLLRLGGQITALDGSPEMLALNRANLADPRVAYVAADLFAWEPEAVYDLVFFAFWLSHVPRAALAGFLDKVRRAVRPGGRVFIVDEPAGGRQLSGPVQDGQYQDRSLLDGSRFRIVKVYYEPEELREQLEQLGFADIESRHGEYFFHLTGRRLD